MARTVVSKLARQPVVAFYPLALGITWLGWLPQALRSRGFFPIDSQLFYVLGGVGPLIAAYVVLRRERGGFALPRLQKRYGALAASLLVGALWALWHLPLLLNLDSPMSTYPPLPFLLTMVARSVIYTWIYNGSAGSVLLVTLRRETRAVIDS